MFIDFREGRREGERDGETNIDELSSTCAPTGDRTHNPVVYGTMLQPTEPLGQGSNWTF